MKSILFQCKGVGTSKVVIYWHHYYFLLYCCHFLQKKLRRLDELDILNADYDSQVASMLKRYPNKAELIKASQVVLENEEQLAALRMSLLQSLALALEYRDTLVELEKVSEVAKTIVASRVIVPSLKDLQVRLYSSVNCLIDI